MNGRLAGGVLVVSAFLGAQAPADRNPLIGCWYRFIPSDCPSGPVARSHRVQNCFGPNGTVMGMGDNVCENEGLDSRDNYTFKGGQLTVGGHTACGVTFASFAMNLSCGAGRNGYGGWWKRRCTAMTEDGADCLNDPFFHAHDWLDQEDPLLGWKAKEVDAATSGETDPGPRP